MKYYLHDSNSFNDEKITELFINFGYEGLGLFYTILEKLASQEKPIKTDVLKHQLKVGKKLEKCWKFMESLQIISSNNGETFNKQLLNYSEKYKIKKEINAKRISEWRDNQTNIENVTCYESVRNTPKVKVSKVKVNKVNNISFDDFWILYDKRKGDKTKLEAKWNKLTDEERTNIMAYIPKYIKSQPDKKYRKDPATFLNNKSWNDELIGYREPVKAKETNKNTYADEFGGLNENI
jgi:hypothetical protein